MRYRRIFVNGGTYFFTVVTYQRRNLFCDQSNIDLLHESIAYVQRSHPFITIAQVILPNHLHVIWELPEQDSDYPMRWYLLKSHFSRNLNHGSREVTYQRMSKGERAVWQRRYWEHTIWDDNDLDNHIDYIHFNPVHHGLVNCPSEWEHSTFKEFVQDDRYPPDWTMDLGYKDWKTVRE